MADKNIDVSEVELNQNLIKMDTLMNMLSRGTNDLLTLNTEFKKLMEIYSFGLPRSFGEKVFNQLGYLISVQSQLITLYRKMLPEDWLDTLTLKGSGEEIKKSRCNFCSLEFIDEEELKKHLHTHKRKWEDIPEEEKKAAIEHYKNLIKKNSDKIRKADDLVKNRIFIALRGGLARSLNLSQLPEEILRIKLEDAQ